MIKDIKTLKEFIPTIVGDELLKYEADIANATDWLRSKVVGPKLMPMIEDLRGQAPRHALYHNALRAVAYRAYLTSIAPNDLVETNKGFAVVSDDIFAPASTARVQELTKAMTKRLSESMEMLIEYLEDTPLYHEAWSESPAFTLLYSSYIPTLRMFQRYGEFKGSYSEFVASAPIFRAIIIDKIERRISRELSAQLLEQIRTRSLSGENAKIIDDLRTSLAAYYNNDPSTGDTCLFRVRQQLEAEPDKYPAFRDSALYAKYLERKNRQKKNTPIGIIV